ncbi:MAG: AAA family ATPase [Thermodesulfobacteriota bacterium]
MNTPREIAELLAADAEGVCRLLLPGGRRAAQEWRCGSVSGEEGQSLAVRLEGDRRGLWADFATGEKGDLLDLWVACRGISLPAALKEAREHLGLREPAFSRPAAPKKVYKPPVVPPKAKPVDPESPVGRYLIGERKLSASTVTAYGVQEEGRAILFPFPRPNGPLAMAKRLKLDRGPDGKKDIRPTSADQEPALFGWQAVPPGARSVIITEGETDAMSWYQYGFPALSVPFGGGGGAKQQWIETEFENLQRFDEVFLSLDMDESGRQAAEEIAERLGRHRCRVVELPLKDANDCLRRGISREDMAELVAGARTLDPTELRNALDFSQAVEEQFRPPAGRPTGFLTPWSKVGRRFALRPAEVTVVAGTNGHGKSEGVGHLVLGVLGQGGAACVASLEYSPAKWLSKLARQAAGMADPSPAYLANIMRWFGGRLWGFDAAGTAKAAKILETFAYARKRYGIDLFVIDNLSKLDIDLDDYNGQRRFVDSLGDFAKEHNCHVILVAHTRKGQDDSRAGGKMDIKGSGAIADLADNVLIWWRNRPKEEEVRKAGVDVPDSLLDKPDAVVRCEKQRHGEEEPVVALWFDKESHQFLEYRGASPRRYVQFSKEG